MADPTQPSDDALYFSNSSGPDLFDASEDPNSKNGTPQFTHRRTLRPSRHTRSTSLEPGPVSNLTPGASTIP